MQARVVMRIALFAGVTGCASLSGLSGGGMGDDAGDANHHVEAGSSSDALAGHDGTVHPDAMSDSDAGSKYRQAVLTAKPLAYWRLGEMSSTKGAIDETGNNSPGSYAACVLGQPGAIQGDPNTAALFDGTMSYVDVGAAFGFPGTAQFTVEAWIKPARYDTKYHPVFVRETTDDAGIEGYALIVAQESGVWLERFVAGTREMALVTTEPSPNVYTYVVGTYDGTMIHIYVNGLLVASMSDSRSVPSTVNEAYIGGFNAVSSYTAPFDGVIDEVAVYDVALESGVIGNHYLYATGASD